MSGGEHSDPELAGEVGPAGNTLILSLRFRSGGEHSDPELAWRSGGENLDPELAV